MDTKDKLIGIAMILLGTAMIVLGAAFMVRDNRNVNVYNDEQGINNENETQANFIGKEFNVWNGIYYKENGDYLKLYRASENKLNIVIAARTDGSGAFDRHVIEEFDLISDTKLEGIFSGTNIVIEKTDNGVLIKAHSVEDNVEDSVISGNYKKVNYKSYGWDGVYTLGDKLVIISEIEQDEAFIYIADSQNEQKQMCNSLDLDIDEEKFETEDDISTFENNEFVRKKIKINITKSEDGIILNTSCEDEKNFLNSMSGKYKSK